MEKGLKYQSILVICTGLTIFGLYLDKIILIQVAVGISVATQVIPILGDWLVKLWFKLAEGLGWVNSRIILSILFYLFLFPFAVLFRLSTKNPLSLKRPEESVFKERNHQYQKKDMENIW